MSDYGEYVKIAQLLKAGFYSSLEECLLDEYSNFAYKYSLFACVH